MPAAWRSRSTAPSTGPSVSGCPTDKDCEYDKTLPITVLTPSDPIFAGLPTAPEFVFWHHDEVISSPEFSLLAKTASCKYQVLKHKERLIYTTQFHPELRGPHGVELMTNFFNLCKRLSAQGEISLAFNSEGVAFSRFLIELNVTRFAISGQGLCLSQQGCGLSGVALAFLQKQLTL